MCITLSNFLVLGREGASVSDRRLRGPANGMYVRALLIVHKLFDGNPLPGL